jgi:hypothetical protein
VLWVRARWSCEDECAADDAENRSRRRAIKSLIPIETEETGR